jgi:hypothetical protein
MIDRLDETISAVCPISGVSVGTLGDSASVRIDFKDSATQQQRTAARDALAAFDWSEAADTAWREDRKPERKTFRQRFQAAVARLQEIEGATNMTNAQQTTAINDIARIQLFALRAIKELND